jgi:hypothetical protein
VVAIRLFSPHISANSNPVGLMQPPESVSLCTRTHRRLTSAMIVFPFLFSLQGATFRRGTGST